MAKSLAPLFFVALIAAGCGHSGSGSPISPSANPSAASQSGSHWTMNSNQSSNHVAQFLAADGTVLDFWRGVVGGGAISDLRVRKPDGSTVQLQLDSLGRPTFLEDPAGTKLWINQYLDSGKVDVTIVNRAGASWRGIVNISSAGATAASSFSNYSPLSVMSASIESISGELLGIGNWFCDPEVRDAISKIVTGLCLIGAASAVMIEPITGMLTILQCVIGDEGDLVQNAIEDSVCAYVRAAAAAASDPNRITTDALDEDQSPMPTPPSFPTPTLPALIEPEDCLPYNPVNLYIIDEGANGWLLTDSRSRMVILDNEADAKDALALAKRHTAHCFIGRDNARPNRLDYIVEYWTGNSGIITTILQRDCLSYNPVNLRIVDRGTTGWSLIEMELLTEGVHMMLILDNQRDAQNALILAQRYTNICFIGRNNMRPDRAQYIFLYWE